MSPQLALQMQNMLIHPGPSRYKCPPAAISEFMSHSTIRMNLYSGSHSFQCLITRYETSCCARIIDDSKFTTFCKHSSHMHELVLTMYMIRIAALPVRQLNPLQVSPIWYGSALASMLTCQWGTLPARIDNTSIKPVF